MKKNPNVTQSAVLFGANILGKIGPWNIWWILQPWHVNLECALFSFIPPYPYDY